MLGMSERHFRRLCGRYEEEGVAGLADRRLGKPSPRRAPASELARACGLYRERYADFTVKHFHEHLARDHDYRLGYTLTRLTLQKAGLVKPAARRAAHRKKRARRPQLGMLLFQDGSTHRWIPALDRSFDLIVTLDDATGRILSAFLIAEEGTIEQPAGAGRDDRASSGCSVRSTPIAAPITSTPPRPAGGSTRPSPPRSAARWPSSPSRTFRPTRPRPAAAWSAPSGPCRTACRRSCGSPASSRSRPPTASSPTPSSPTSTPASPWRPRAGSGVRAGATRTMDRRASPAPSASPRQRQHRLYRWPAPADPGRHEQSPLRPRQGARQRIPRRRRRPLLGTAPHRRLPAARGGPP